MIQNTLENRVILCLIEALLGGLVFLLCVRKTRAASPGYGSVAFAFLCFSGAAVARSLVPIGLLSGDDALDLIRLFSPLALLETVFLGALVVGLLPSRRAARFAAVLLAVFASAYLVWRLVSLQGSPGLSDLSGGAAYLHAAIALLLCVLARRTSPRRSVLFQFALALLAASYVAEVASEAYPSQVLLFWNAQCIARMLALLGFALNLQEGSDLYVEFALRLGLSVIVTAGFFLLLLSETLREGYLEVAAKEAQVHLGEFLHGHVIYLHQQGLTPNAIVERDELIRKVISEFTEVAGLKRVKLSVGDRQLFAEIDRDGLISVRTGTGIFDDRLERVYDYQDYTVDILRAPVISGENVIGAVQFDGDLLFLSRVIVSQMALALSSLMVVAFVTLIGGLSYTGYRRMQRVAALQAQVQQAQKMEAIGLLAGGVAHDFNNLLTAILGYSELLLDELHADHPLRQDVEEIKKAGGRATALTRQLLAFSRKQMLQTVTLNLNAVLRDMEPMVRRLIREDVEIIVVVDPALKPVKADATQIEQLILNLVINARDAMPLGGRLTVQTANVELRRADAQLEAGMQPGWYVALSVSDTGLGMDAAVRARLFEPFFTTKPKGKGTGLGLSVAYGIVKQSGGSIQVASDLGRGATFTIHFPAVDEEDGVVMVEAATPAAVAARGTETVLVVEDEEPVRALVREALHRSGYTVFEASDGEEAISLSQGCPEPIHLLLTDLVMPGFGGRILADRLALPRPAMKVLYMSGHTDDEMMREAVRQATVAFLPKPFSADILLRKVREVLDSADQ
jgi:signal transduction histidine kinase/ActR/RegA family two-component response regulator